MPWPPPPAIELGLGLGLGLARDLGVLAAEAIAQGFLALLQALSA